MAKKRYTPEKAALRAAEAAKQMREKKGPFYDKWLLAYNRQRRDRDKNARQAIH